MLLLTHTKQRECYECGQLDLLFISFKMIDGHAYCSEECINENFFVCCNCNDHYMHDEKMEGLDGKVYCPSCYDDKYCTCEGCNDIIELDDANSTGKGMLCTSCYEHNYYVCERCGCQLDKRSMEFYEHSGDIYCSDCYHERFFICSECDDSYSTDEQHTDDDGVSFCSECFSEKQGAKQKASTFDKVNGIKTYYGIEIECCSPYDVDMLQSDFVDVAEDGSISPNDEDHAIELRLGILQGDSGIVTLERICNKLAEKEAYVNRSTGLHVHIDATGISIDKLDCIKSMAYVFDKVIFGLMPRSRRANSYCQALKNTFRGYKGDFSEGCDRYRGFNLESLEKHSTIEFRYHSGTTNYNKIYHWVVFCLHFVTYGQGFFWTCDQFRPSLGRLRMLLEHIKIPKALHEYYLDRFRKFNPHVANAVPIEENEFSEVA